MQSGFKMSLTIVKETLKNLKDMKPHHLFEHLEDNSHIKMEMKNIIQQAKQELKMKKDQDKDVQNNKTKYEQEEDELYQIEGTFHFVMTEHMKYELDYIEKLKKLGLYITYRQAASTLRGLPHTRRAITTAINNDMEMLTAFKEYSQNSQYPIYNQTEQNYEELKLKKLYWEEIMKSFEDIQKEFKEKTNLEYDKVKPEDINYEVSIK